MRKWQRILYQPCLPMGEDGRLVTASPAHIALSRRAACEGMVLLKNENKLLPLKKGARVALFGVGSADYVKGGGGSGDVTVPFTHSLIDATNAAAKAGEITVFEPLQNLYSAHVANAYAAGKRPGNVPQPTLPDDMLRDASHAADTAIISICRYSSEGWDRKGIPGDGDFYLTAEEQALVNDVTAVFPHTVVVLNVGGMVDTSWFRDNPKIEAVLLAWQAGLEGGFAEWDILSGKVTPSGHLCDTFASCFDDYPSSANFNESDDYVEYTDDIYVGYRYFETIPGAKEKVNYPFGYGLSYTTFAMDKFSGEEKDGVITLTCRVTNTGDREGKQVVQAYYSAPQGKLGKPKYALAAFAKTDTLAPGESRRVTLTFPVSDMASFDDTGAVKRSCRVLEAGAYKVYLGSSVRDLTEVYVHEQKKDEVTETLHAYVAPHKLSKRLKADGTYEALETSEYPSVYDTSDFPAKPHWGCEYIQLSKTDTDRPEDMIHIDSVVKGERTMAEFLAQMSDEDIIDLLGGVENTGVSDTHSWGGQRFYGIPYAPTCDGPAGVRISPADKGVTTTAWPCATLLACSWNTALVEEVGAAGAKEVKENNMSVWLTPALNIHRSPLCGRNFEYYSEDPYLAGKMAAACVRGIQSQHIGACIKHFCCNNKETNRKWSDSRVSERALREIYLRAFEITVKESDPWSLMTSYNLVNGVYPSENKELLTGILRGEWGFRGMVTTDWNNDAEHYREVLAGNDVRMPTGSKRRLQKALSLGLIERKDLEACAARIIELILKLD